MKTVVNYLGLFAVSWTWIACRRGRAEERRRRENLHSGPGYTRMLNESARMSF
jgi:hypothetical protein